MAEPLNITPQEQLQKIEDAIAKLQSGERIASVSYNGHSVSYFGISLEELLKQKQRLQEKIAESSNSAKRQVIFSTHKGAR
jgi:major membrane immunogen (membrane-anchored lipoprotein)